MGNLFNEDRDTQLIGGGYGGYGGGFGGSWCIIIVFFVIAWLLFKDGHNDHGDHGYHGGYGFPGYGGGCGPCVQPTFKDESNFEEERNINAKLCCIDKDIWETDRDVWKTACETQKEISCDGQKTRALIEQNYIQDLRDKLAEKNAQVMTLKQEMFTEKKFDQVLAAIGKTDNMIEKLDCECLKRPPVWGEGITPDTHHTDCDHRRDFNDFPRRGKCDGFGWDGCCA